MYPHLLPCGRFPNDSISKAHDQQAQIEAVQHDVDDADSGEVERLVFKCVRKDNKRNTVVSLLLYKSQTKDMKEGMEDDSPVQAN